MVIIHKKHKETKEEKEERLKKEQEQAMGVQDEYQARGFELVSWVQDHKGLVCSIIVLLLLAGGLFSAYLFYQDRRSEAASSLYMQAMKTLEGGAAEGEDAVEKKKKAQAELEEVAKKYPKSKVATLAKLYAAHLALDNKEPENSVKLYQEVLQSINKSDVLYSAAMIGLGYAQEINGDKTGALTSFESLIASKDAVGKDLALYEAARLIKDESKEKAREYIANLLEQFPQSIYDKNAAKLKESLK